MLAGTFSELAGGGVVVAFTIGEVLRESDFLPPRSVFPGGGPSLAAAPFWLLLTP
jgi:hypothetical protein